MSELKGRITNIQQYCVHDGPGIRTTVFLKGCPLRCKWCSNPETQQSGCEMAYSRSLCIHCGACIGKCPLHAITAAPEGGIRIDHSLCNNCGECMDTCYAKALHRFGQDMTVEELYQETSQSRVWRAGTGITVSGGEVLLQADFAAAFLKRHHDLGTSTAIETSGFGSYEALKKVAEQCDVIFYDVKHADPEKHLLYTGQRNDRILENLKKLSAEFPGIMLCVRTPVIEGINDRPEELQAICDILKTLPHLSDYELLPYHGFGAPKYGQIGRSYELEGMPSMAKDRIAALNNEFRKQLNLKTK